MKSLIQSMTPDLVGGMKKDHYLFIFQLSNKVASAMLADYATID